MIDENVIISEIEKNKEEYVDFLVDLVQTESYNPPGNEKNVALKIEKYLKKDGIKCEIFPFDDNRANLFGFLNDNFDGKNLLYNGHMDVVPPGLIDEWKSPPLSGQIKRKKFIYGRGTADMKGALAAMTIALKILNKLDFKASGNLILNAVADEETGGKLGTKWCLENVLKERSIKCDFAIVGEPSGLRPLPKAIIVGEKGHLQIKINTNGISCHASIPFMGKNPIYMMSDIIQNFDKIEEYIPKVKPPMSYDKLKELIGDAFPNEKVFEQIYNEQQLLKDFLRSITQFTKSLTMINGGIKANVIPDYCEAIADLRLIPGQTPKMIINAFKRLIKDLGYEIKEKQIGDANEVFVYLEVSNENEASYWKGWEDSDDLKSFYSILENVYKKKPFYFLFPACTDAHFLRNEGYCTNTIVFGPGNAGTAHAVNEYIEIEDFINAIKTYSLFAYDFLT